jgi:hypothetical protein
MLTLSIPDTDIALVEVLAHQLLDWVVKRWQKSLFSRISVNTEIVQSRRDKRFLTRYLVCSMGSVNSRKIF